MEDGRVAIVGFGHIGSVIGGVLADRGRRVIAFETNPHVAESIRAGRSPFNEPGLERLLRDGIASGRLEISDRHAELRGAEVVVLTVGTPLGEDGTADLSQVRAAAEACAPHLEDGQLVIVKSTVPPRTTLDVVAPVLRRGADVRLAYCPERLAEGKAVSELTSVPVVVGGIDADSTEAAATFWQEALGVEVIRVADPTVAELAKLADNLWIDLNIALANELARLSDRLDVDVMEVIQAANSLPKVQHHVNILVPSVGVGGACLTKDPWFVHGYGASLGVDLQTPLYSRRINERMPEYSARLIAELTGHDDRPPEELKIAVLGLAFKRDTGDCRRTPAKPVIEALAHRGYRLEVHDPWVAEEDARAVAGRPLTAHLEDAVRDADCVAVLAGHREFREVSAQRLAELARPGALVFDGRMFFSREEVAQLEAVGLRYKGVGR